VFTRTTPGFKSAPHVYNERFDNQVPLAQFNFPQAIGR
jgi:hypothetical protein